MRGGNPRFLDLEFVVAIVVVAVVAVFGDCLAWMIACRLL